MNQLAQMFQEMHMIIVEQGTLLDRVDQNLVIARHNTQEGVRELTRVCHPFIYSSLLHYFGSFLSISRRMNMIEQRK